MLESPAFRLLVGLGNPGREYAGTRHNIGFMLLDLFASRERVSWRPEKSWQAEVARIGSVHLCKPLTFMNLSGQSVRPMAQFYKIEAPQILVIVDDLALPLGKLRFRASGSSGGHNGLQSMISHFGTPELARLRIGIGGTDGSTVHHVLGRFALEEQPALSQALDRALEAIDCAQSRGLAAAMNTYN
jgi:PTH1 family peptidyl-tRNA hydrolase